MSATMIAKAFGDADLVTDLHAARHVFEVSTEKASCPRGDLAEFVKG